MSKISQAATICTETIASEGLVHLFGTGHSRVPVEEMFPRYGSFPGFHPIVDLSLTFHTNIVGANGHRQALFLERVAGLGEAILSNFVFTRPDSFLIFSHSGVNEVVVEVALGAQRRGLPLIAVVSLKHCAAALPRHCSGKRLPEIADVVIDTCALAGDAMVAIEGLPHPVGPGSTIGVVAVANAIKCLVADQLTRRGQPPTILTHQLLVGEDGAVQLADHAYDEHSLRVGRLFQRERPRNTGTKDA
jgi:uncharacterized phosphosugar-binding protein